MSIHSVVSGANQSRLRQAVPDGTIAAETVSVVIDDIVDDHRNGFSCYVSVGYRLAQPALVCAAHDAVDTHDLQMAGDTGPRCSDHHPPARGPPAHLAWTAG